MHKKDEFVRLFYAQYRNPIPNSKKVDFIVMDVLKSIEDDIQLSVSLRSITRKRGLAYGTLVEE